MMVEELGLMPINEESTWKEPAMVCIDIFEESMRILSFGKSFSFYLKIFSSLSLFVISQDGLIIFISFLLWGSVSLLPYLFAFFISLKPTDTQQIYGFDMIFLTSCGFTGIALFILGALKSLFTAEKWYFSGLFVFLNGFLAGLAGYVVGYALGSWFGADASHV